MDPIMKTNKTSLLHSSKINCTEPRRCCIQCSLLFSGYRGSIRLQSRLKGWAERCIYMYEGTTVSIECPKAPIFERVQGNLPKGKLKVFLKCSFVKIFENMTASVLNFVVIFFPTKTQTILTIHHTKGVEWWPLRHPKVMMTSNVIWCFCAFIYLFIYLFISQYLDRDI